MCHICSKSLMSPLSKDETRHDSSLTLTINHYTVIKTRVLLGFSFLKKMKAEAVLFLVAFPQKSAASAICIPD